MAFENPIIHKAGRLTAMALTAMLFAAMLAGAWAGHIDPATWALPSMLCLVFPMLWLLCLGISLLWLFFQSRKVYAAVCGVCLMLALPTLSEVSPLRFPDDPQPGTKVLRLLTYNVAGFQDIERPESSRNSYSRSLTYILDSDADIVCLQELFSLEYALYDKRVSAEQTDSLKSRYPYCISTDNGEEVLLSKYPATLVTHLRDKDLNYFNYQLYHLTVDGHTLHVLNVHLPSYELTKSQKTIASSLPHNPGEVLNRQEGISLYAKLRTAFETRAMAARKLRDIVEGISGPLIVCGDFNDVPGSYAWQTIRDAGLEDAYCRTALGPMVTFNAGHMFFHIDQVMYRPDCGLRPYSVSRGDLKSSDHYPVTALFALDPDRMK